VTVTLVSWLILGTQARTAAGQLLQDHLTYISSQIDVKLDATDQLKIQASTSLFNKAYSLQQIIRLNPAHSARRTRPRRGLPPARARHARRHRRHRHRHRDLAAQDELRRPRELRRLRRDAEIPDAHPLPEREDPRGAAAEHGGRAGPRATTTKFAGVARLDEPGIIQVGQSGVRYEQSLAAASVSGIAPGYTVEKGGFVLIASKNQIVSASDASLARHGLRRALLPCPRTGAARSSA
jgi:hypothetical protein